MEGEEEGEREGKEQFRPYRTAPHHPRIRPCRGKAHIRKHKNTTKNTRVGVVRLCKTRGTETAWEEGVVVMVMVGMGMMCPG